MERESITLAVKLVDGPDGAVKKETNSFDIFRDNSSLVQCLMLRKIIILPPAQ